MISAFIFELALTAGTGPIQPPGNINSACQLTSQQCPPVWTPEGVLIFMGLGIIFVLLSIVAYLGKRQLDNILTKIEAFSERQTILREKLPSMFADKTSTALDIKELYRRTDHHEKMIERHSTMLENHASVLGGRRAQDHVNRN